MSEQPRPIEVRIDVQRLNSRRIRDEARREAQRLLPQLEAVGKYGKRNALWHRGSYSVRVYITKTTCYADVLPAGAT